VIQPRVAELRQQFSERRQRVERQFGGQPGDVESSWDALSQALDELLKSLSLDTAGESGNHE
jgi:polyphosphate kinase 2 (PPK2 family)